MAGDKTLQADAFKRLYPEEYFDRFVQDGIRPDGRTLGAARATSIGPGVISAADASVLARIGSTTALAGVRLEVFKPGSDEPDQGQLQVNVDFAPTSTPDFRPGRPPDGLHFISDVARRIIAGIVDLHQLCIKPGQAGWYLYLDAYLIDADGAALDAVLLAAIGALSSLTLPAVCVTKEGNVVRDASGTVATPLQLLALPVSVTCGVYKGTLVVDPTAEEEALIRSLISVVVDEQDNIRGVFKPGGSELASTQLLHQVVQAARERHKQVAALVQDLVPQ